MKSPKAFTHLVYRTSELPRLRDWYLKVLNGRVVLENPDVCFLTYDDQHHRIALFHDPNAPTEQLSRVDHISYSYGSLHELHDLLDAYDRLRAEEILPYWTVNHGPTTSFYYRDPDGNGVEFAVDNFETAGELHGFFSTPEFTSNPRGIDVDPDDLRARLSRGEPVDSVVRRADLS